MISDKSQDQYVTILQTEPKAPSLEYLRRLVKLHLNRIPFENISKLHYDLHQGQKGLQWLPSMDVFLDNVTKKGLGGNCYILNAHFGKLLKSLGFQVNIVRATGGNTHFGFESDVIEEALEFLSERDVHLFPKT